ncbi:LYR motif-containing protein 1 isoform X2 [Phascolarctos cinereus]
MKPECCSRKTKIFVFFKHHRSLHSLKLTCPCGTHIDSFWNLKCPFFKPGRNYFLSDCSQLTDSELIKQCIDECTARIEIGLHYQIPYPRPIHLPPMALTPLQSRGLQTQEKLRKYSKPLYLKSHNEVS